MEKFNKEIFLQELANDFSLSLIKMIELDVQLGRKNDFHKKFFMGMAKLLEDNFNEFMPMTPQEKANYCEENKLIVTIEEENIKLTQKVWDAFESLEVVQTYLERQRVKVMKTLLSKVTDRMTKGGIKPSDVKEFNGLMTEITKYTKNQENQMISITTTIDPSGYSKKFNLDDLVGISVDDFKEFENRGMS